MMTRKERLEYVAADLPNPDQIPDASSDEVLRKWVRVLRAKASEIEHIIETSPRETDHD